MAKKKEVLPVKKEPSTGISPFEEAERWFEDVLRRPFPGFGPDWWPRLRVPALETVSPSVDIYRDKGDTVLKAEIPGMKKEDLHISITDDTISISGEKKKEERVQKKDYYRYERSSGSFCRSFHLPRGSKTDKATAKFQDGVLEIRIPMAEESKKKEQKIKVQ